jgi:hypothetical protein
VRTRFYQLRLTTYNLKKHHGTVPSSIQVDLTRSLPFLLHPISIGRLFYSQIHIFELSGSNFWLLIVVNSTWMAARLGCWWINGWQSVIACQGKKEN